MTGGRVFSSLGLALLLTSATIGVAFFGARSWLTFAPAVVGAVFIGLGIALGARGVSKHTVRLVGEIAVVTAIVVVLNVVALRSSAFVDVTAAQRNTLSEASTALAKSLRRPVVVESTLDPGDRAQSDLLALVERFRQHTDQLDVVTVKRSGELEAGIVLVDGERRQKVPWIAGSPDQEQSFTNALRALTMPSSSRPRAYFVGLDVKDDGPAATSFRRYAQALANEGLEVVPLPLAMVEAVPDDAAFVVVDAAPPDVASKLQRYLDKDGSRMLALVEPTDATLAPLVGSIGVQANNDVIVDGSSFSGLLGGPNTATGVAYAGAHAATSKLGAALTHFPGARSLAENPIDVGSPGTELEFAL